MFHKFLKARQNFKELQADLDMLRGLWGNPYAAEAQALLENRLKEPALQKRASGLLMLGRSMRHTQPAMADHLRWQHLWNVLVQPGVAQAYKASAEGWYDPEKFYVDALDLAAVVKQLTVLSRSTEQPLSQRMVDDLTHLNLRCGGSYFGYTPYWRLYERPMWRAVDRTFSSVQAYWFMLEMCDQLGAEIYGDLSHALQSAQYEWSVQHLPGIQQELAEWTYLLALGAAGHAAHRTGSDNKRAHAFLHLLDGMPEHPVYLFQQYIGAEHMQSVRQLKTAFRPDHPLQLLPDGDFILNLKVQAALIKPVLCVELFGTILGMPDSEPVLSNAAEELPHLQSASM